MVRADYRENFKWGGVCDCFKESLSIRFVDVPSNLDECLLCELSYQKKLFYSYFTFLTYSIKRRVLSNSEVLIKDIDIEFRYWIDIDSILNQNEPIPVIMGDFNATGVKKKV